jgi:phytoene dehydrogenase-like protein
MTANHAEAIIVGAGLTGLSCARRFLIKGFDFLILEASDRVGGRIRTDLFAGFILNRGFQVLQTAYPEAQQLLDNSALNPGAFAPGALFRIGGRFHAVTDPQRAPRHLLSTLLAPIGTLNDRMRMARLARQLVSGG